MDETRITQAGILARENGIRNKKLLRNIVIIPIFIRKKTYNNIVTEKVGKLHTSTLRRHIFHTILQDHECYFLKKSSFLTFDQANMGFKNCTIICPKDLYKKKPTSPWKFSRYGTCTKYTPKFGNWANFSNITQDHTERQFNRK